MISIIPLYGKIDCFDKFLRECRRLPYEYIPELYSHHIVLPWLFKEVTHSRDPVKLGRVPWLRSAYSEQSMRGFRVQNEEASSD